MKKFLILALFVLFAITPVLAADQISVNLSYRAKQSKAEVKKLQQFLIDQKFMTGSATGTYAIKTKTAVKNFQIKNKIKPATGNVTLKTRQAINKLLKASEVSNTILPSSLTTLNPGCSSNVGYSITTGQSCNTITQNLLELKIENSKQDILKKNIIQDCNKKDFTMALVLVTNDKNISKLNNYKNTLDFAKNKFPWAFKEATRGLATMSIPNDPVILSSTGLESNGVLDIQKVLKKFYESNPDNFDFVSVYSNYGDGSYHSIVRNNIHGTGLNNSYDMSDTYGSKGRLIGVNYILDSGDDRSYSDGGGSLQTCYKEQKDNFGTLTDISSCGLGLLLHEVEHRWGMYAGDAVTGSKPSAVNLGIKTNDGHIYYGLNSPEGTKDPLGFPYWKKSPDGSVYIEGDAKFGGNLFKYHPFVLYFMGLLPQNEYDTKFDILQDETSYIIKLPDGGTSGGMAMASVYKQVSVRDIIAREGERKCVAN